MKSAPRDMTLVVGTAVVLNLLVAPLLRELMNAASDWAWRAMVAGLVLLVMVDGAAIAVTVNLWRKR